MWVTMSIVMTMRLHMILCSPFGMTPSLTAVMVRIVGVVIASGQANLIATDFVVGVVFVVACHQCSLTTYSV